MKKKSATNPKRQGPADPDLRRFLATANLAAAGACVSSTWAQSPSSESQNSVFKLAQSDRRKLASPNPLNFRHRSSILSVPETSFANFHHCPS